LDTASITEEHFYIGFEEYLTLGRENGTRTCNEYCRGSYFWRNHSYV